VILLYGYTTRIGTFYIGTMNGRFYPVYDGHPLGCYRSIDDAVSDLSRERIFSARDTHPGELGIPGDLTKWQRLGAVHQIEAVLS
jgi:hypothetical protein